MASYDKPPNGYWQPAEPPLKRILFVDDEPEVLDGLRDALRRYRHQWNVRFASSGEAALAEPAAEPADVVVSDIQMPGMNGASLLLGARALLHPSRPQRGDRDVPPDGRGDNAPLQAGATVRSPT